MKEIRKVPLNYMYSKLDIANDRKKQKLLRTFLVAEFNRGQDEKWKEIMEDLYEYNYS
jgi:hypothetical protein